MRSSWQTKESEGDSLINEGTELSSLNLERGERGQGDSEHQLTTLSSSTKPHFSNNIFISHSAALSLHDCSSCLANSLFPSDIQQELSEGTGLQPEQETSWKEGTEREGPKSLARQIKPISNKNNQ